MKLLLDVGNSYIKSACLATDGLSRIQAKAYTKADVALCLKPLLAELPRVDEIIVASVAGSEADRQIKSWTEENFAMAPRFLVTDGQWHELHNHYRQADQLGIDRWLAMIAAWQEHKKPCIVLGAGTAITFDMINQQGEHLGGLILPGLDLMYQSLLAGTDLQGLEKGQNFHESLVFADNTAAGVQWGTFLAVCSLAQRIVTQMAKQCDTRPRGIITGGNGATILAGLGESWVYDPTLVFKGMALKVE